MNSSANLSLSTLEEAKAISDQHHNNKTFQLSQKTLETWQDTNKRKRNGPNKLKGSNKL